MADTRDLTLEEVRRILLSLFPPGSDDLYDWHNTDANVYKITLAIAEALKELGFDYVDTLRTELFPQSSDAKLPDYEAALGINQEYTALEGTTAERQDAVIAQIRASNAATIPNIQSVMDRLLGYDYASDIEVLETNRAGLTEAHTYTSTSLTVPAGSSVSWTPTVADTAVVSSGGARVEFTITHAQIEDIKIDLTNPVDLTTKTWAAGTWTDDTGAVTAKTYILRTLAHQGLTVGGTWNLTFTDTGANPGTVNPATLFVEGAQRDTSGYDGLGSVIFEWGVFVDPTRADGGAGVSGIDFLAVKDAIGKLAPAHTLGARHPLGTVIRGSSTVSPGTPLAIPDDPSCIPNEVIPTDDAYPFLGTPGTYTSMDAVLAHHVTRRRKYALTGAGSFVSRYPEPI